MAHILIVVSPYYKDITDELLLGARTHLEVAAHSYDVVSVPGAFEIPAAIHMAMQGEKPYDGYIALGCVIRGETTHYDYVCTECARGLQDLAVLHQTPIGFGVLTVENKKQAEARASVNGKNKGREAAEACMQMIALKERFGVRARD